jgi:dienelactone hydrolase
MERLIPYGENETLEGFVVSPSQEKRPCLILCHAWRGRDEFICEKANWVASLGYVGFAIDLYGKGVLGHSKEENVKLKKPFLDDRSLLQRRLLMAYEAANNLPFVDTSKIVALGFGFGGLCALDLARAGVPLVAAVSVYGHFEAPPPLIAKPIRSKILLLHGHSDPIVPCHELMAFGHELTAQNVDWQAVLYGGAKHAFITPSANDPAAGIEYHPLAAKRAWTEISKFLCGVF